MFLLASLDRTPYEVNTFTSNTKDPFVRSAHNCLCAQETPIELRRSAEQMSNKQRVLLTGVDKGSVTEMSRLDPHPMTVC